MDFNDFEHSSSSIQHHDHMPLLDESRSSTPTKPSSSDSGVITTDPSFKHGESGFIGATFNMIKLVQCPEKNVLIYGFFPS